MQKDSKIYLIVGLILAVVVIGSVVYVSKNNSGPGKLDSFATCLKDQGAVFYGTFWCPHCIATKKLFGNSAKLLPYVECSTPDGNAQTQVCIDKGIKSYPTWIFKDGSELYGEVTLEELSQKTSCPINSDVSTSTATTTTASTTPKN
jgi:thiol-disulfide isomerase/thioredoxin